MAIITLHFPKNASQATIHLSKDLIAVLDWQDKDQLSVSKPVGEKHLVIENISEEKRRR